MRPLVSVIVPVYKVEKYLPRCLDSLGRQTLYNIEILLIDDASPDQCGKICEQYATQDARFKVSHHTKNKGLSAARNTGIQLSSADYLMFVDSDDWVHKDFCKSAYECAVNNQADIVIFGYKHVVDKPIQHKQHDSIVTAAEGHRSFEDAIDLTFTEFGMVAWNKLYRRSLFEDVFYPEGQLFEDTATSYKLFLKANHVYCLNKVLYYYFRRAESITMRKQTAYMIRERMKVCVDQCCKLSSMDFRSKQFELFKARIALSYCIKTPIDFSDPYYIFSATVIQHLKKAPQEFTWKQKFLIKLFQLSPRLFNRTCFLSHNKQQYQ